MFIVAADLWAALVSLLIFPAGSKDRVRSLPLVFVGAVVVIALVLRPESRFVIMAQVMFWVLALGWLCQRCLPGKAPAAPQVLN